ncbi:disease resistance protein RPM1-like [Cocos nucifera]|uniref:Disease resistance protein RPM1-like n=1 Tax=Cocos nucifera TaxID=13894 RepID=A0A8K0HVZ1_COCNU|nr:disease resistance protein RPM1-like [Cocos nucifera]
MEWIEGPWASVVGDGGAPQRERDVESGELPGRIEIYQWIHQQWSGDWTTRTQELYVRSADGGGRCSMAEAAVFYLIQKISDAVVPGALEQADFLVSHLANVKSDVLEVKKGALKQADFLVSHLTKVQSEVLEVMRELEFLSAFLRYSDTYKDSNQLVDTWVKQDEQELSRLLADSAHFIEEDEIVGFKHRADLLVNWMMDEEPTRTAITVWGMGGVGKTTLVTSVYNTPTVRSRFDCNAWVSVSQNNDTVDLLRRIIKELYREKREVTPADINLMDYRRLVETLRAHLQQKRYLIILDDVWRTDVWNYVSTALFDNNTGSRIVITTRNLDVASIAVESRVMSLKPLEEDEAWTLFCRNAFRREKEKRCPPELEYWARKIASKCQGLPLAIKSIGNLLSVKERTEVAWRYVHDALGWKHSDIPELQKVSAILNFSINDLPYYLRNCLLYCSLYPDDYEIEKKTLIRLCVAEGFVENRGESTMEEVAEDYLNQLVGRCMLQVKPIDTFRRTTCFKVHHLVRDLIVAKSRNESFCRVYDKEVESRSGLSHTKIRELPEALGRVRKLETLDARDTRVEKLPNGIIKLENLRHLMVNKFSESNSIYYEDVLGLQVPKGIWNLKLLQTLKTVAADEGMIQHLENLTHMRNLDISDVTIIQCTGLSTSISKMKFLHNLAVKTKYRTEMLRLESLSPPPLLRKLTLYGKLEKGVLPCWLGSVTNLSKLRLRLSGLKQDFLFSLSMLPNLEYLSLEEAYEGEKLHFRGRWFPKLKILWLRDMAHLSCIQIEKESLINLRSLILAGCRELKRLPLGIENLTHLQKLGFDSMPIELLEKLRHDGEDRQKVSHIPIVRSWVMREDKWIEESLS